MRVTLSRCVGRKDARRDRIHRVRRPPSIPVDATHPRTRLLDPLTRAWFLHRNRWGTADAMNANGIQIRAIYPYRAELKSVEASVPLHVFECHCDEGGPS